MQYIYQHYKFFGAKGISTNICNLEVVCLFIYQVSIKDESTYQSIARNSKLGWYNTFRKHVTMSTSSSNTKLVLIGDSINANFDKCSDIFDKFFLPFCTLNFGISGDKMQNVLWRAYNMTLPASVEYVIIHSGTNNLGHSSPLKIAKGLINIACILKKNYKDLHIFVSCLLPRAKR